jgi:hypothetical protein
MSSLDLIDLVARFLTEGRGDKVKNQRMRRAALEAAAATANAMVNVVQAFMDADFALFSAGPPGTFASTFGLFLVDTETDSSIYLDLARMEHPCGHPSLCSLGSPGIISGSGSGNSRIRKIQDAVRENAGGEIPPSQWGFMALVDAPGISFTAVLMHTETLSALFGLDGLDEVGNPILEHGGRSDIPARVRRCARSRFHDTIMARDTFAALCSRVMTGDPCLVCGQPASKKCGRCRSAAFCGPACQAQGWQEHRSFCKSVSDLKSRIKSLVPDKEVVAISHERVHGFMRALECLAV